MIQPRGDVMGETVSCSSLVLVLGKGRVYIIRLIRCPKTSWTLAYERLKTGPEFLPTLTILFCPTPSHAL